MEKGSRPWGGSLRHRSLADLPRDRWRWETELGTNFYGLMNTLDVFMPHLREAAQYGEIADLIALSSVAAAPVPMPLAAVYGATKAAVEHLLRSLREELYLHGVRACCMVSGLVATDLHPAEMRELLASATALDPHDVAGLVASVAALPPQVGVPSLTVVPTGMPMIPRGRADVLPC